MSTFSNNSKTGAFTATNATKNASTMENYGKAGYGYPYDSHLTYDELLDPVTNLPVYYDTVGTLPTWSNQSKN